jgi:Protein of unknown function (DUF4240)
MYFAIVNESGPYSSTKLSHLQPLQEQLEAFMGSQPLGAGLHTFYLTVNCVGKLLSDVGPFPDFPTGLVIHKKYTKSRQELSIKVKLNFAEVMAARGDELPGLLHRAISLTRPEVEQVGIKGFEVAAFYGALDAFFAGRYWERPVPPPPSWPVLPPGPDLATVAGLALGEARFWEIIGAVPDGAVPDIEAMVARLAQRGEEEITGFEVALRDQVARLNHYRVIALAHIIDGYVSDDSLLQFQCALIARGQPVCGAALDRGTLPPGLDHPNDPSEWLLSVADRAMELKLGPDSDHEPPSSFCRDYKNYNAGFEIAGEDYDPIDLPKLYPQAWAMYGAKAG